ELSGQQRILRVVLEIASPTRITSNVDPGTEENVDIEGSGFQTEGDADAFDQFDVPGLSEPGRRREAGRRFRGCETEMVIVCSLRADPMRTVGQHRRSQPGRRFGRPERGPAAE